MTFTEISGRTAAIVIGVCLVLAGGYWYFLNRQEPVPAIVLKDANGEQVTLDKLSDGREHTLMVFMLSGCSISKYSVGMVNEAYDKWSPQMAFAGLFLGSNGAAEKYADNEGLDFPVYGLREIADPFSVNELIKAVGTPHGLSNGIYGGTVVVFDRDGDVVLNLARDQLRELPDKLQDLLQ